MNSKSVSLKRQIGGLLLLAGIFESISANAQSTDTWVGGSGNNFSTIANWNYTSGSGPVAPGDALIFDVVGSTTPFNDLTGLSFPSITFNSSGPGYTISGNPFTLGTSTANMVVVDFSSSDETINANITLGNNNQTLYLASGNLTLGGVISGAGANSGLLLNGGYTLTLNGANTYGSAGATTNSLGTIKIGNPSALGASRLYVAYGATVDLNGNNLSTAFINNIGALTAGVIDNVSAGGSVMLTVGSGQGGLSAASGTYTSIDSFSGVIQNSTGTVSLKKVAPAVANQSVGIMATASLPNGGALLRLMNTNAYTGSTIVSGGMLELNFGSINVVGTTILTNIISTNSPLMMGGGDLIMDGVGSVNFFQTFSGLTLNPGASHIGDYRNSGGTATALALNGITRNTGATVDFQSRPSGSSSNQKIGAGDGIDSTTNVNANFTGGQQTILGGYATFNGNVPNTLPTWAMSGNTANTTKNLSGLGVYTTNSAFAAGKDMDAAAGTSTPAAMTINSLRFAQAGAATVSSSGNIVIATGGILEAPQVGANAVAINNNNLTSGNGQDLIVNQLDTGGAMTIGANIVDNGGSIGLTKSGQGALTLTPNSANTFSGPLTINAGTVTLGNANALNGAPAVVFGGTSQTFGSTTPSFLFANGTLNLNGNNLSVASLTASADSSGTPTVQNASATPATLTVNGAASQTFVGTIQNGTGGGTLSLNMSGTATQTIGGTLSYSGSTTVSGGTLALTATPSATPTYTVNSRLDVTALSSNTLTLVSPQVLGGSGTVNGSVYVSSGAHTLPGASGVTNTITGNLTYTNGGRADFDLSASATSGSNDQIILSGNSSVLNCGGVSVNINLMGASLDVNNDYVLFNLTGSSAVISNTFNATPIWLGTVPANSTSYSIITDVAHKKVVLHYISAAAPIVAGAASPTVVVRNESTFISVTNTPGSGTITNVYLDLTAIGGSSFVPLTLSSIANVYTSTIVIPAVAPVGNLNVQAYAKDTTPLTGAGNISLTILAGNEVWNGNGPDANWSTNPNWVSGLAPGLVGDSVTFDGTTQLAPVMDNSYTVSSLTFDSTAGAFNISSASNNVLTVAVGITNNSPNAQILSVPVAILATQVVNTAGSDITIGGAITGGGLTKVGNNTLYLTSGANTYTGNTTISNGTISISENAAIGSGQINLAGGNLASGYQSGTRLTLANNLNVPIGNTGTIVMSTLNRLNGSLAGAGVLNVNAPGSQDDLGGGWNAYAGTINFYGGGTLRFIINGGGFDGFGAAAVTFTNETVQISDNSTGNSFGVGAMMLDSTATIAGPYQGNSPNFIIGGLNQNDLVLGSIQGSTRITKVGTGNLTIASTPGIVNYTGQTIVSNGTLTVIGAISSSPVTNYSGSTLTGTGTLGAVVDLEPGSTITPVVGGYGTMTCGSDLTINGGTNLVYISTTNVDLITVGGSLNLLGGGVQLVIGNALTNGVYRLITYSGALGGAAANLSLSGFLQSGQVATLSDATAGEIDLLVTTAGGANLVWAGTSAQDNLWNISSSLDWKNGTTLSVFNPGDHVTFNDLGAGNTFIDVRGEVQPSSMVVTGTQAYVFTSTTGTGRLSGPTNSLTVLGTGSLEVDTVNNYGGPTVIGTGSTLTLGNGAVPASTGTGAITNNGTLVFNQTNNLLLTNVIGAGSLTANGSGTLTLGGTYSYSGATTIGSGATIQAGTGNSTGPLLGSVTDNGTLIMDQSGIVNISGGITGAGAFVQNGSSVITMSVASTYQGNTYVNHGVLKLGASNVIPGATSVPGSIGWFILDGNATNAGTFDLNGFNDSVNLLQGLAGTIPGDITNSASSGTSVLAFGNDFTTGTNGYAGLVTESSSGGKIQLLKQGANINVLSGANSYSGGTIVTAGQLILQNNVAAGSGSITLSNGATLGLLPLSSSSSIFVGNSIYTAAGAEVTNTSASLGNAFGGLFFSGDVNSTNVIEASVSVNDPLNKQFQSFAGTVLIDASSELRFSSTTLGTNGGDNTTFEVEGTLNTRNGTPNGPGVSLGALTGSGFLTGAINASGNGTYIIGAKGIDSTFAGTIQDGGDGNVSIVKAGPARLTLTGSVTYTGNTTVSNGVLALVDPVSFDTSPNINLGSTTAVIDVSGRGDDTLYLGNSTAQTLSGIGAINGNLYEAANSPVRAGLGTLTVSNTATFNGTLSLQLNRTNANTHSEIKAGSFAITCPLTVTNVGPALQGGDTFQLFSTAVSGFTATNLPVLTGAMYWTNRLAIDGSIAVINPVNTTPTNIVFSVSGGNITLSWPADHTGWYLQEQTNSLSKGLGANWVDVPGSSTVNSVTLPINPANPAIFYRMSLNP